MRHYQHHTTPSPNNTRITHLLYFFFFLFLTSSTHAEKSSTIITTTTTKINKGASLLRIDPGRILQTMTKYGGLILPRSVEDELKVLENVCSCDTTYLDVLNRQLEVVNFTVGSNNNKKAGSPALRVGRLFLQWDSYLNPCVEVELEDVDILVEFLNLMLTRNNWLRHFNEMDIVIQTQEGTASDVLIVKLLLHTLIEQLNMLFEPLHFQLPLTPSTKTPFKFFRPPPRDELDEMGFPPKTQIMTIETTNASPTKTTFVRVGSVDLKGSVKLRIRSKPLDQPIGSELSFDFASLKELTNTIRQKAAQKKKKVGCTTEEVYDILSSYVNSKLKQLATITAMDMAKQKWVDPDSEIGTFRETKKMFTGAKDTALKYAEDARSKTERDMDEKIKDRFKTWGMDATQVEKLKSMSRSAAGAAMNAWNKEENVGKAVMKSFKADDDGSSLLKKGYEIASNVAIDRFLNRNIQEVKIQMKRKDIESIQPDDIFFPPW